jgi:hypothetical protein
MSRGGGEEISRGIGEEERKWLTDGTDLVPEQTRPVKLIRIEPNLFSGSLLDI